MQTNEEEIIKNGVINQQMQSLFSLNSGFSNVVFNSVNQTLSIRLVVL